MTASPAWRQRRVLVPAVVAVVALSLAVGLALLARSQRASEEADLDPIPPMPTTTINTGGIEVSAPEGWLEIPLPDLSIGLAVPERWEAALLSDEVLQNLERSTPAVPGFLDAAHAAAESGSVLYAAGQDDEGRVSDLKVRAAPQSGVTDAAGLLDYARRLAADAGLAEPAIAPVEGAERPTVQVRYRSQATSPEGDEVAIEGTETLVLGPRDIVWSLIVTSESPEDPASHERLADRILDTLTLEEPAGG